MWCNEKSMRIMSLGTGAGSIRVKLMAYTHPRPSIRVLSIERNKENDEWFLGQLLLSAADGIITLSECVSRETSNSSP
jgi:hypothetical protein